MDTAVDTCKSTAGRTGRLACSAIMRTAVGQKAVAPCAHKQTLPPLIPPAQQTADLRCPAASGSAAAGRWECPQSTPPPR